jgi:hypothetical protein
MGSSNSLTQPRTSTRAGADGLWIRTILDHDIFANDHESLDYAVVS